MTPEELRKEARAAEFLATLVSYARDKQWLSAKASELRRQADTLDAAASRSDLGEAVGPAAAIPQQDRQSCSAGGQLKISASKLFQRRRIG